jgi:ribose 5-phosphate isomerase RpiB
MTLGLSKRVVIATDHGGFGLKEELVAQPRAAGHEVVDFGAHGLNPGDDYPDFVIPLAQTQLNHLLVAHGLFLPDCRVSSSGSSRNE